MSDDKTPTVSGNEEPEQKGQEKQAPALTYEFDDVPKREIGQPKKGDKVSKASTKKKKTGLTTVRRVTTIPGLAMIVEDESTGIGYLAPLDTKLKRGVAVLAIAELEQAYDWTDEIETMLPDRGAMILNIRRSIWKSGGYRIGKGHKGRRMNQAWPYHLREE